jgi:5-methylthioribose kinase
MFTVDERTVWDYFRGPGKNAWKELGLSYTAFAKSTATPLAWGVSNLVLRVDTPALSFVIKQSRRQLRTKIEWFSRLERIWREAEVLCELNLITTDRSVPKVLFEDRDNYLFGMEAIEADHRVWKAELLGGNVDPEIAKSLGRWLALIHQATTNNTSMRERFGDREVFKELRLDPFYQYVADTIPHLKEPLTQLITQSLGRSDCLVLADFSPKNVLLTQRGPVIVDFETAHFGDPAFDVGFCLSHLLLKATASATHRKAIIDLTSQLASDYFASFASRGLCPEWAVDLDRSPTFEALCAQHLAACMLARVAGKSRVDYLDEDACRHVVEKTTALLTSPDPNLEEAIQDLAVR